VPRGIWQVIELGQDIMPTNIFTKFDKDRMKTLTKRGETLILDNSRTIFQECLGDLAGYRT